MLVSTLTVAGIAGIVMLNVWLLSPKSMKLYSIFAVQFGKKAYSTPTEQPAHSGVACASRSRKWNPQPSEI